MMKNFTEEQIAMEFGSYLKEARLKRAWYQDIVAAQAGISQVYYCNIEQGKRMPTLCVAMRLCEVLGLKYSDFIKEIETKGE